MSIHVTNTFLLFAVVLGIIFGQHSQAFVVDHRVNVIDEIETTTTTKTIAAPWHTTNRRNRWMSNFAPSRVMINPLLMYQPNLDHLIRTEVDGSLQSSDPIISLSRRYLWQQSTRCALAIVLPVLSTATNVVTIAKAQVASAAVERAVGSGEVKCRAEGNCLQIGELDGAVGWEWGGKDRCDPSDPMCGPNGKLRTSPLVGKLVPELPTTSTVFSHVASIEISIGRNEIGTIKVGLYGNECPRSVSELIDFLSSDGLSTLDSRSQQNTIGSVSVPVSLSRGGMVTSIVPQASIDLGVPLQSNAYARSLGISKVSDTFIPQPRPNPAVTENDLYVRQHDCAGLVSIPSKGIGYGGTGFESDDEAYESAFLITNDAIPVFDSQRKQQQRRVIGQVIDAASMSFLERLTNLPTNRGIRGVIPGQTSGPPLVKTVVHDIKIAKVTPPPENSTKK